VPTEALPLHGSLWPSAALAFQLMAIPASAPQSRIRNLTEDELAELERATDEALGMVELKNEGGADLTAQQNVAAENPRATGGSI